MTEFFTQNNKVTTKKTKLKFSEYFENYARRSSKKFKEFAPSK
jgi:hypothetical protein